MGGNPIPLHTLVIYMADEVRRRVDHLGRLTIGIDASNLRAGGGLTHLVALLSEANPARWGINHVTVWGGERTLARLPDRPWLQLVHCSELDGPLWKRLRWQQVQLQRLADDCDLLFVPGGSYLGRFRPFVTMSRNLLPFDIAERRRYPRGWTRLRYALLERSQTRSFRAADAVVFLNQAAQRTVEARTGPLPGRTVVIPHGVGDVFRRTPRRDRKTEIFSVDRPLRLLYVSIVNRYKHQWAVVEAAAMLRARGVPVHLDLVGPATPDSLARLQSTMMRVDPGKHFVTYRGPVDHQDLPATYHKADAFVFASTCENMPNILIEAMASGLPIACSDRGPMPEILRDAGVYFDPEDPSSIADALYALSTDAELRSDLALAAFELAEQYSWKRCANDTFSLLAEVARQHGVRQVEAVSAPEAL